MKKLLGLATIALAGCASMPGLMPPVTPSIAYVASDHEAWREKGTATVSGQGFLRQQGGGVVTCAGEPVYLVPKSPYFDEVAAIIRSGRKPDMAATQGADVPGRQGQCDAQGSFRFSDLPAAEWYVVTQVRWSVGYSNQGGELVEVVKTSEGETTEVLLTDEDRQ